MNIPKTVRQNLVYMSFWTKEKGGTRVLDFKSKNRGFAGNWERAEHSQQVNFC